jgi:hypothetical protein
VVITHKSSLGSEMRGGAVHDSKKYPADGLKNGNPIQMMDQMMDAWEEQIKSPNPVIVFLGDLFERRGIASPLRRNIDKVEQ